MSLHLLTLNWKETHNQYIALEILSTLDIKLQGNKIVFIKFLMYNLGLNSLF